MNQAALVQAGKQVGRQCELLTAVQALPAAPDLVRAWNAAGDLRNDVAHCGFRKRPRPSKSLVSAVTDLAGHLDQLPL